MIDLIHFLVVPMVVSLLLQVLMILHMNGTLKELFVDSEDTVTFAALVLIWPVGFYVVGIYVWLCVRDAWNRRQNK